MRCNESGEDTSSGRTTKLRVKESLGPVSDLEEHVNSEWWRGVFNSLYLKTDEDVVNDGEITEREIDLILSALSLSGQEKVLDLCCGQGRHSLELARRSFSRVEGLDRSRYLIRRARARAKKEDLSVRFREGDARKLPYSSDSFDVVLILGNSFGYFETVQDDIRALREALRVLKPSGRILIDVADGDYLRESFQSRTWEWVDKKLFVCRERCLSRDRQRLISREVISNTDEGVVADQFYAVRLYGGETVRRILEEAGFSSCSVFCEHRPDSKRNQDLGMMEKRLIVTAQADKPWTIVPDRSDRRIRIIVALGDPRKPDPVKPDSSFDEDDHHTIDQMKKALSELGEYEFMFLDNHDTLLSDLAKLKNEIDLVFNLCDEGCHNDPRKELHMPAILEFIGLPYSGAGPQSLAYCYDKSLVRGIALEMGVEVPQATLVNPEDLTFEIAVDFPVIVKPNFGDSSFGITKDSVVNDYESLLEVIASIRTEFGYDKPILIEEFLTGKDLSLGVIGNSPSSYSVLPIIEEDYSVLPDDLPRLCGYEAKWRPDSPYWQLRSIPAELPERTEALLTKDSMRLFERLECRDYARFDWRLDRKGEPKLLEVNPNPGWCWDGHLAKMAAFDGISYPEMLRLILQAVEERLGVTSSVKSSGNSSLTWLKRKNGFGEPVMSTAER
ncbi:methyltransferase domain-containing protein [Candidatus Hydrogenedentota bacterium]